MRRLIKPYNDDNFLVAAYNEFYCSGKHTHDFYEIKYIISGVGKHIINDAVFPVHSGDVYMIAPGTSHYFESKEKENPVLVYNLVDEEAIKLVRDEKLKTLLKKPLHLMKPTIWWILIKSDLMWLKLLLTAKAVIHSYGHRTRRICRPISKREKIRYPYG